MDGCCLLAPSRNCGIAMPLDSVSGFILAATTRKKSVMQTIIDRTPVHEADLQNRPEIRSMRIAKNHAQLMALVDALALVIPLTQER